MIIAKFWFKQTAAQEGEHFSNNDLIRWAGKGIASDFATGAFDEPAPAENPHQLGHIGG